jgi:hypothetical protein
VGEFVNALPQHMISKGVPQLGCRMMGVDVRIAFKASNAFLQSSSKMKGASFTNSLHKGWAILLKSWMNRK